MKKLKNLAGVTVIRKSDQQSINGGVYDLPNCGHYIGCVIEVNPITGLCFCAED